MENAFSSFILGLLCTGGLFALCFLVVAGVKAVLFAIKEKLTPPPTAQESAPPPPVKARVIKRRKPKSVANPVRSIEIDPDQIDKIYVKKIS